MRKLTIRRKKSFIGCLAKVHLFIESDDNEEAILLNDIKCVKIGTIKNGENLSLEVPDEEKVIFAAYDTVYKTAYRLEEGIRNVILDLIIHFSPVLGNPIEIKKA